MTDASLARADRASWRLPVAPEAVLCAGLAAVVASLLAWLGPAGGDFAAHAYQRWLFLEHGFTLWDGYWYAGRYAFVGYSVLYYPLAALVGIRLLAVLGVAVAAAAFSVVVGREWGRDARWSARSFALLWPAAVVTGEFPFLLGIALALLALAALQAGRRRLGAVLILLVLAASPVAFALLAVVLAGAVLARRPTVRDAAVPALAVGVAAAAGLVQLRLFPAGGTLGFPLGEAAQAAAFCVVLLALLRGVAGGRLLSGFLAVYLAAVVLTYAIPSGLGHDVARVRLLAVPLALLVAALRRWRPLPLVLAAVALAAAWNVQPPAAQWLRSTADRSSRAALWTAPAAYLRGHLRPGYRVEAVDTSQHWPALYLARAGVPLVRGWFRQNDEPFDALLYRRFSAAEYDAWLRRLGVEYVVLTDAPPDYTSRREAALVRSGAAGLRRVFATRDVSIYAVPRPRPIVTGPGSPQLLALTRDALVVRLSRRGTYRVAVRWSPYWRASAGCVARSPEDMLRLRAPAAGTVTLRFGVDAGGLWRALTGAAARCR